MRRPVGRAPAGGSRGDRAGRTFRRASAPAASTRLRPGSAHRRARRKYSAPGCAPRGARSLRCRWSSGRSSRDARACGAISPRWADCRCGRGPACLCCSRSRSAARSSGKCRRRSNSACGRAPRLPAGAPALRAEKYQPPGPCFFQDAVRARRSKQCRPIPVRDAAARRGPGRPSSRLRDGRRRRTRRSDRETGRSQFRSGDSFCLSEIIRA